MEVKDLSTLKIHKLSQAQYDREAAAGNIDDTAIYLTPDEGGSGTSSWNDLQDKPFGEKQAFEPIVWDGNTETTESFDASAFDLGICYKISDHAITQDELQAMKKSIISSDYGYECCFDGSWLSVIVRLNSDDDHVEGWLLENVVYVQELAAGLYVYDTMAYLVIVYSKVENGPSVGTYLCYATDNVLPFRTNPPYITVPLDEKYLPESYINSLIDAKLSSIPNAEEASF